MAIIRRKRACGPRYEVRIASKASNKQVYVGTFDNPRDAAIAEAEAKRRLKLGERPVREEILFSDLATRWLKGRTTIRSTTKEDYRQALSRVKPYLAKKLVSEVCRRDFDAIIGGLSDHYAACTVRKTIVILKMVLRSAIDWGYIEYMPAGASRLALPKTRRRSFAPLEPTDVRRLIASAPEYWRPWLLTSVTTGLRRGEMFGLTWAAVDLERGELLVRQQLIGKQLLEPKSEAAYRRIPLPAATIEALKAHKVVCPRNDLDLVFPMPSGAAVCASNWYARVFIPTREAAKLPTLRVHDLRHVYASALIRQGRSIKYIQTVMGHANASITLNVYGWLYPDEGEQAAADMDRWLSMECVAIFFVRGRPYPQSGHTVVNPNKRVSDLHL
jgi:integrase